MPALYHLPRSRHQIRKESQNKREFLGKIKEDADTKKKKSKLRRKVANLQITRSSFLSIFLLLQKAKIRFPLGSINRICCVEMEIKINEINTWRVPEKT